MNSLRKIVIALWVMVVPSSATTPFHTSLLERIAAKVGITHIEPWPTNADIDSVTTVRGKSIHMRTNSLGEVSHIGYHLFNKTLTDQYQNPFLFEFVERYLLELDLGIDERAKDKRMAVDQVTLVSGSIDLLRELTPQTDLSFSVEEIKRKLFRLKWAFGGHEVCITIPADCQLIFGANAIELENIVKRNIPRLTSLTVDEVVQDWTHADVTRSGGSLIVSGGIYMSDKIRGDLYLTEGDDRLELVCTPKRPVRSVSNIMLTGIFQNDLPMQMALNEYGNRTDTLNVTLQQFITYCRAERCKFYFGVKGMKDGILSGTLFAFNENLAYTHMLAVEFPLDILKGEPLAIRSTAYVYIPLRHVEDKFFKQEYNPELYDEN